jgi:hypothetical protein
VIYEREVETKQKKTRVNMAQKCTYFHVDLTRGLINGGRLPLDESAMVDGCLCGERHLEISVGAELSLIGCGWFWLRRIVTFFFWFFCFSFCAVSILGYIRMSIELFIHASNVHTCVWLM